MVSNRFNKYKSALVSTRQKMQKNQVAYHQGTGTFEYDIVGEAVNREHLLNLISKYEAQTIGELLLDALLVPEPENLFDQNAVKVLIENKPVGYIPKNESGEFKKIFQDSNVIAIKVDARIGWDKNSTNPLIGVRLDLNWDEVV